MSASALGVASHSLELISLDFCSNVVFRVHRLFFEANSPVFRDMFSLIHPQPGDGMPYVELQEAGDLLNMGLPYLYPAQVQSLSLGPYFDVWPLIKMFDKYEVSPPSEPSVAGH